MAYIKQVLDQDNNEILPITNTTAVLNPDGQTTLEGRLQEIESDIDAKQDMLISGVNIKTVDGLSVLGAGDLDIRGDWEENSGSDPGFIYNRPPLRSGTGTNSIIEESLSGVGINKAYGGYSHAEGVGTFAWGIRTHAEGYGGAAQNYRSAPFKITADQAAAETYEIDNSDGVYEGMLLYYNGVYGQVDYVDTVSDVDYLHMMSGDTLNPEGPVTEVTPYVVPAAIGLTSHTEGEFGEAIGQASHAEGGHTRTLNAFEHAQGQFNVSNKTNNSFGNPGNTLASIGMGLEEAVRGNAIEVMQNGDIYFNGVNRYDGTNAKTQESGTVQSAINESFSNVTTQQDGSIVFVKNSGDTITVDLTHTHPGMITTDGTLFVMSDYDSGGGGSNNFVVEQQLPNSWQGNMNFLDINAHLTVQNMDESGANVECWIEFGHYEIDPNDDLNKFTVDSHICSSEIYLSPAPKAGGSILSLGNVAMNGGAFVASSTHIRTSFRSTSNIILKGTTPLNSKTKASQILARVYKYSSQSIN